jgi:hypothetical protein
VWANNPAVCSFRGGVIPTIGGAPYHSRWLVSRRADFYVKRRGRNLACLTSGAPGIWGQGKPFERIESLGSVLHFRVPLQEGAHELEILRPKASVTPRVPR